MFAQLNKLVYCSCHSLTSTASPQAGSGDGEHKVAAKAAPNKRTKARAKPTKQALSLDSLNLLHTHTVLSTSGQGQFIKNRIFT